MLQFLGRVDEFEGRRPLQRNRRTSACTSSVPFPARLWPSRSQRCSPARGGDGRPLPPSRAGSALRSPRHSTASAASAWRRRHSAGTTPSSWPHPCPTHARSLCDRRRPSVSRPCHCGAARSRRFSSSSASSRDRRTRRTSRVRTAYAARVHRRQIWVGHPIVGVGWEGRSNPPRSLPISPQLTGASDQPARRSPHRAQVGRPEATSRGCRPRARRARGSCSRRGDRVLLVCPPGSPHAAASALVRRMLGVALPLLVHRHPGRLRPRQCSDSSRLAALAWLTSALTPRGRCRSRGSDRVRAFSSPEAEGSSARTSCGRCSSEATRCACSTTSPPATAPTSPASTSRSSRASSGRTNGCTTPCAGVEVVFHLGALGSVPRSVQDPLTSSAVNIEGTLNVLLAARDEGVRRVVFSSSSSVYGPRRQLPAGEDLPPDPISPTGSPSSPPSATASPSRRVYESFESVVVRYFNVFGPRQSPMSQYAAVDPAVRDGDLRRRADHGLRRRRAATRLHVRHERRRRTIRAAEAPDASGKIFNVAASAPASVNDVAAADRPGARQAGREDFEPPRVGDIRDSWADISAAREVLGWEPTVGLEEGLRLTVEALV